MRRTATLAVVAALMSSTVASGQYTFGDWASDNGYSPGDAMPGTVDASWELGDGSPTIESLDGIGEFDWTTTPTTYLELAGNQITRIESGAFNGLTNLTVLGLCDISISRIESGVFSGLPNLDTLYVCDNPQLSSIESGAFSGLTDLTNLWLDWNLRLSRIESGAFSELTNLIVLSLGDSRAMRELNLEAAGFSSLLYFDVGYCENISSVSLRNAAVNQTALAALFHSESPDMMGIGELQYHGAIIAKMDLSGIDFGNVTDLWPLYAMDDLTDLWFVNTQNVDATALDVLLDNLETIEGTDTEGILYMTQANFDAFNVAGGGLLAAWNAEQGHHVAFVIPEPSTLLLALVALGVVGGWRKWKQRGAFAADVHFSRRS